MMFLEVLNQILKIWNILGIVYFSVTICILLMVDIKKK